MSHVHHRDASAPWTGQPRTLETGQSAAMAQTPNGSMVLAYWNKTTFNNAGRITLTSGGAQPVPLDVPALANAPSLYLANWRTGDLRVTNTSDASDTPIEIEAFGPGLPGFDTILLRTGETIQLGVLEVAEGKANAGSMTLNLKASSGSRTILALIGGPTDADGNNAYVFALNATAPLPPGYAKASSGNSLSFPFRWGADSLFVVNMSPSTGAAASVTLVAL